jgi:DNA invertase Pin-like site-specific DNA recombinase
LLFGIIYGLLMGSRITCYRWEQEMRVAYVRVSTDGQNTDRQAIEGVERTFEDKASGGSTDRPALQDLIAFVREGDTVAVWSIDRLARSLQDLLDLIDRFNRKGVTVEFVTERLTFSASQDDPFARLQLHLLGAIAQFEKALIKKRQREGIEKAKARGNVYKGRAPSIDRDAVLTRLAAGATPTQVAREMGVSRPSVYRIAAEAASA